MAVHFDSTITLGTLISAVAIIVSTATAYVKGTRWLEEQLTTFRMTLQHHGEQISHHSSRMDGYEVRYMDLAKSMERLLGRMEATDRRSSTRSEGDHR